MKNKNIKVRVILTEGYERRFTEACLKVAEKRQKAKEAATPPDPERETA